VTLRLEYRESWVVKLQLLFLLCKALLLQLKIITDVQKITVPQKVIETFFNDCWQLSHLQSNRSVGTTSGEREVAVRFKRTKPNMFVWWELHHEILPKRRLCTGVLFSGFNSWIWDKHHET